MYNTSIFLLQGIFTIIDSEGEGDIYEKDVIDYIKKQKKGKMDIKVLFIISFKFPVCYVYYIVLFQFKPIQPPGD